MIISRTIESIIEDKLLNMNKIVIIYGARQTGKTTLCRQILNKIDPNHLYINADQSKYQDVLSSKDIKKLRSFTDGYKTLFIDEAQRISDLGLSLKILNDEFPELKIVITGSSSIHLSKNISESLTGRKFTYQLFPLSIEEISFGKNRFEVEEEFEDLLVFGAYPEIYTTKNQTLKKELLHEITESYIFKDILELTHLQHPGKLKDLLKLLAYQIGSQVSIHELSKKLGINKETIERYLNLLEMSYVIYRMGAFSSNLRKEINKQQKFYFRDLGIRNTIIGNHNSLKDRNDVGQLWENFVINERIKYHKNHNQFIESYFWRTYSGTELDLVEINNGKTTAFEIKYAKSKQKPPPFFTENYPDSEYFSITKENLVDFTTLKIT